MTYRLLARSCTDGSCPTFEMDDVTGDVMVTGYDPDDPTLEPKVLIPAAKWAALMANLNAGR